MGTEQERNAKERGFAPSDAVLAGRTADVYFLHARDILDAEGLNPNVVMEVFANRAGVLCGMREVVSLLSAVLPKDGWADAMQEGASIEKGDVVLRIGGPYRAFGIYETAILGTLAHETGWATAARQCVEAAEGVPVFHFGARHVHPDAAARLEYAAMIGGCTGCSTTDGATLSGIEPSGTMPHALILCIGDTVRATQAFDRTVASDVRRIALVDTFTDEAEESLRVARALGNRLWGVRLDTPAERGRVTPALVKEVRARLDQAGYRTVRIVVSGGVGPRDMLAYRTSDAPVDAYGVGHAISGAPPIDFTADIKEIAGKPIAKRGRIPGRTPSARLRPVIRSTEVPSSSQGDARRGNQEKTPPPCS